MKKKLEVALEKEKRTPTQGLYQFTVKVALALFPLPSLTSTEYPPLAIVGTVYVAVKLP